MALKVTRFISLLATALLAGLLFAHALELPNKMTLPPAVWLAVQQKLYNLWGPVSAPVEIIAILATAILAILVRRRRAIFAPTLLAAFLLPVHLVEWFLVVNPINGLVNGWSEAALPADWAAARNRWELGHAIGAVLVLVALVALILAAIRDGPLPSARSA